MQDGGGGEGESSKSKQITNGLDAYLYTYLHSLCLSLYLSHTHTHYLGIRCRLSVCGSVTILFGPTATTAPLPGVVCVSKASWDGAKMDSQASWLVELPMSAVPTVAAHRNLTLKVRILTLLKLSISFWSIQFGYYLHLTCWIQNFAFRLKKVRLRINFWMFFCDRYIDRKLIVTRKRPNKVDRLFNSQSVCQTWIVFDQIAAI